MIFDMDYREPDVMTLRGIAWNVSHVPRMSRAEEATLTAWFVRPEGLPFSYLFAVISLAPIEGVTDADRHYPEAEWEFGIYRLNPTTNPQPTDYWSWKPMLPPNVIVQFHGCSADTAARVCELAVGQVLSGTMPVEPQTIEETWASMVRVVTEE